METSPKHMRETSEQFEDAGKAQTPIADGPSKTEDNNSGTFFLKLIGVIIIIIVIVSIGVTSCGTTSRTTGAESDAIGESAQDGDDQGYDDSGGSSADGSDSGSGGYSSTRDDSYDYSERDYSSTDDDDEYQRVYDEDSGIYGVVGEDGDGIFAGEDFSMRLNEDGSSIATDGNGNWVMDSDGDGEVDSVSIDGGNTWF